MRRFLSFALAFSLIGYFVAQEPISVADAYHDGCGHEYNPCPDRSAEQWGRAAGYVAGGYVVYRTVTGTALGSLLRKAPTQAAGAKESIYEVMQSKPDEFRALTQILRNTDETETYKSSGPYTVFWPTDAALTKALGVERVAVLQSAAGQQDARHFIASLTVSGSYSLQRLRALATEGKALTTLTGDEVVFKLDGNTLTANGVALLQSEYPAQNGFVLVTEGIVAREP